MVIPQTSRWLKDPTKFKETIIHFYVLFVNACLKGVSNSIQWKSPEKQTYLSISIIYQAFLTSLSSQEAGKQKIRLVLALSKRCPLPEYRNKMKILSTNSRQTFLRYTASKWYRAFRNCSLHFQDFASVSGLVFVGTETGAVLWSIIFCARGRLVAAGTV